eukprot:gene30915-37361_t
MPMKLFVRTLNGAVYTISVEPSWTISRLKSAVSAKSGVPLNMMRLVEAGKTMDASKTISDYNIRVNASIVMLLTMSANEPFASAPAAPANKNEALEKCWSAAYCEEWDVALPYLESGQVSLDELEQRTGRDLLIFFGERNMVDALKFIIQKRDTLPVGSLLNMVNISIKANQQAVFEYLMSAISAAQLQTVEGAVQPLHYALCFGRVDMLRFLLDNGADPNFYASTGGEGIPNHPGTPLHALAQLFIDYALVPYAIECIGILGSHPSVDVNARHRDSGDNALHLLARNSRCDKDVAIAMVKIGVDLRALNNEGQSPSECTEDLIVDGRLSALGRVFKLAEQGKIKRTVASAGVGDEAESKRSKAAPTGPTFHTLDAQTTRLGEWTRQLEEDEEDADDSGDMRADWGTNALASAILPDLPALAADQSHPLQRAAQLATELATKLQGVKLCSETDCSWFPFVVALSEAATPDAPIADAIKLSIRAPQAELICKEAGQSRLMDLFPEEEYRQGLSTTPEEFWAFCAAAHPSWTEVKFPEEAVCYPVFLCSKLELERGQSAIVGIFAIRVDT